MVKFLVVFAFSLLCFVYYYVTPDQKISFYLEQGNHLSSLEDRLLLFSEILLDKKYRLDPLGEGKEGVYDKDPLYRFDSFDCTTYIETVLALALSKERDGFVSKIDKIRYFSEEKSFLTRNHFPIYDWLSNNIKNGVVKDVTSLVGAENYKTVEININKDLWLSNKKIVFKSKNIESKKRPINLNYVPFLTLINKVNDKTVLNTDLLSKLPRVFFFNLVLEPREDHPMKDIGIWTWHQGLILKKNNKYYIRHAHNSGSAVQELLLVDYLNRFVRSSDLGEKSEVGGLHFFSFNG